MARDYPLPLCLNCEFRPHDSETGQKTQDGLRIAERPLGDGTQAAVVYSEEDPRIHAQFRFASGSDTSSAQHVVKNCVTIVEGVGIGGRVLESGAKEPLNKRCRMAGRVLLRDPSLPEGLLYQTSQ